MSHKEITKEEYQDMLEKHDWYYEMSDDSRVYQSGTKNRLNLLQLANSNKEFEQMYKDKLKTIKL